MMIITIMLKYCVAFSGNRLLFPRHSVRTTCLSSATTDIIASPARFVPFPFHYHQEVELEIESLTNRGMGIGRTDVSSSSASDALASETKPWVIMVPGVIPGEKVVVKIFRNFPNYSEADLVEILQPSPERTVPPCPIADTCGGCQWQHMSIFLQREWKTRLVQEALEQYGVTYSEIQPCLGTDETLHYRSKLTPHYQQPAKSKRGVNNEKHIEAIGFQKQTSRQILDVTECLIATPAVNAAYQAARDQLLSEPSTKKKGATLLFRQANLDDDYVESDHKVLLTTVVDGLKLTYRAGNFFQNNYYVLPLMVQELVAQAIKGDQMTHLADCYCGSGLFALSAAKYFDRVVGIEVNDLAIEEATSNAVTNNISNVKFLSASAEGIFKVIQDFPRESSVVVVDPPRKGCSEEFLEQLYTFSPQRIVYMSCDPTTQARDAAGILKAGYTATYIQPFDLFPQTRHIECLMVFEKASD